MAVYRPDPPVRLAPPWLAPYLSISVVPPQPWQQSVAAYVRPAPYVYLGAPKVLPLQATTVFPSPVLRAPDAREYSRAPNFEAVPQPMAPAFAPPDPLYSFQGVALQLVAAYIREPRAAYLSPVFAIMQPVASVAPNALPRAYDRPGVSPAIAVPGLALFTPADPVYAFLGPLLQPLAAFIREARPAPFTTIAAPPPAPAVQVPAPPIARADQTAPVSVRLSPTFAPPVPASSVPAAPLPAIARELRVAAPSSRQVAAVLATASPIYIFRGPILQPAGAYAREPWLMPRTFLTAGAALFGDTGPAGSARLAAFQRPPSPSARPSSASSSRPSSPNSRRR